MPYFKNCWRKLADPGNKWWSQPLDDTLGLPEKKQLIISQLWCWISNNWRNRDFSLINYIKGI